jgi:hypothetical protein
MIKLLPRHRYPFFIYFLCLCLHAVQLNAQDSTFFRTADTRPGDPLARAIPGVRTLYVDLNTLSDYLGKAELPAPGRALTSRSRVQRWAFPLPDGSTLPVRVVRNHTLSEDMKALHPGITTFTGYDTAGREIMRLTLSPIGVQGVIQTAMGSVELTPVKGQPAYAVCYYTADLQKISPPMRCDNGPEQEALPGSSAGARVMNGFMDNQLRTYTLSVAATGEYTTWAGSQANALAYITGSVNNINAVYERDLGVHFILHSPNAILFTDPATDPYSAGSLSGTQLNENQATIDAQVGSANYDVGVLFNAAWSGGLAQLNSVCNNTGKARSAGGLNLVSFPSGPTGKIFDDMIAHEIGHQFGAHHTMSANTGGCAGNVNGANAWEAGGGFTIMAYGGTCTGLAYGRPASYFHGGSLAEMANFLLTGNGSSCATITPLANSVPVIQKTAPAFTIPQLTAFKLQAGATDADGDALTYNWEQLDPYGGTGTNTPPVATSATGPLFRNFDLSPVGIRYFPNWPDFIQGNSTPYEVLPNATRALNCRLTVRDNHAGGGATDTQNVVVNVASCGPFSITSHTANASFTGMSATTLTWNTATACVNSPFINILFSRDGGLTFTDTILRNTPNDGSENITIPNKNTCYGRFLIESANNIFYAINSGVLSITSSCLANGTTLTPASPVTAPPGSTSLNMTMNPVYGTQLTMPLAGDITAAGPWSSLTVQNPDGSCKPFSNQVKFVAIEFYVNLAGAYTFTKTNGLTYNLYRDSFDPNNPCQNFITSTDTSVPGTLRRGNSFTRPLCTGIKYILVATTFSTSSPLPAPYSMTVTGPGSLHSGPPAGPGYLYSFVIVNKATQKVMQIAASANLSNGAQYPMGSYEVHGLSSNLMPAVLNTSYAGKSFSNLATACLNGTICGDLSTNLRPVTVSATLPLTLLSFSARLVDGAAVRTQWEVEAEEDILHYEVERSYDGLAFESIGQLTARNDPAGKKALYELTDGSLALTKGRAWYRLKIEEANNQFRYSSIAQVQWPVGTGLTVAVKPNPVYDMINMELGIPQRGRYTWQLTNPAGQVVQRQQLFLEKGSYTQRIPVAQVMKGVYYLSVTGNGNQVQVKIIKL